MSMTVVGHSAGNHNVAAQQGTIVLLPQDSIKPALCVITGVLAEVAVLVGPAAVTILSLPELWPVFIGPWVIITVALTFGVVELVCHLYDDCNYGDESTLRKHRQTARRLNFGALVDRFGLERVSQYNLLTPAERREKYAAWKKNPQSRDAWLSQNRLCASELLKFGFITPEEFTRVRSYRDLNPTVPANGHTGLAAREEYYQAIGWEIDPAPGREFRKKVAYLHVSKVFAGHDFEDMAFRQEVFTSTEYETLMRLKKMYEAAKGPGAPLAIHECNEEFHREFAVR